jgi:NADP-dependent 3-hydroxy acid dehydrogenase YdfG
MKQRHKKFKTILITGASSGIGAALALFYANNGTVLALSGRNQDRLADIKRQCEAKGALVDMAVIDVTDKAAMERWILEIDDHHQIDLIIANAGISAGTGGGSFENLVQIEALFATNWQGVLNTISPVLPRMIARKSGHIALMSSLAGYRGWPGAPAYCASKAAVKVFGEGLRGVMSGHNINVSVICPGFVQSAMTDKNNFPMPFKISAQ